MPDDLERLHAAASAPGAGPAVLAGELLGRVWAELLVVGALGDGEQVLVAAWLTGQEGSRESTAWTSETR
jgi:hypothetical protein